MPIPSYQAFVEPLLRVLAEHEDGVRAAVVHEAVASILKLSDAEKAELLPSGQQPVYKNRNGWAHDRLKRAGLSESSAFGTWRLTSPGRAFINSRPGPLSDEDLSGIVDITAGNQSAVWRDRVRAFRADSVWSVERSATEAKRNEIRPEVLDLLRRYLAGACSLETFRSTFDQKTRRDWATFGAKGTSGAMVLNQLAKYAPDVVRADEELKRLITAPSDGAAAAEAIAAFLRFLEQARASSSAAGKLPQTGRIPFFASSFWHVQDPEDWPAFYESARSALAGDGLYEPVNDNPAEDYLAFRTAFTKLQGALDLSSWDLESLLRWTQRDEASPVSAEDDEPEERKGARTWLIALGRNADQWEACRRESIIVIGWNGIGDLSRFPSLEAVRTRLRAERDGDDPDPINASLACWEFAHEMREGDVVYVKKGRHAILAQGVVRSAYRYEADRPLANVRDVEWLSTGEWKLREKALSMKTLTEIGHYPALVSEISALISGGRERGGDEPSDVMRNAPTYSYEDAEKDLFLTREQLEEIVELARYKKNIILQGPPGVGKTFVASRIAQLLIGTVNEEQIHRVQFHPSYAYEDFVQGLRPTESGGFERKDGPLLSFCKEALEDQKSAYVLIIDEINRGNISKILGELLSLLEADKRDPKYGVTLAYAREGETRFHVPPNLYVIGMMNTADRSLALVDYALRRRFAFIDLRPAFQSDRFEAEMTRRGVEAGLRRTIRERLSIVNAQIARDPSLGPGFEIGHSYFCQRVDAYDDAWLRRIIEYEIGPLLREYWCDSPAKLDEAVTALRGE